MSWNKNTVVMSILDDVAETLRDLKVPHTITILGHVAAMGLNDEYGPDSTRDTYPIRRLACDHFVVLEKMVRNSDCDMNDYLISTKFPVAEEPKDWTLEETVDEDSLV